MTSSRGTRPLAMLAFLGLLATGLAVLPAGPSAAEGEFAVRLVPPSGQTAVQSGDRVGVDGQAPDGELTAARLVVVAGDGTETAYSLSDELAQPAPGAPGAPVLDDGRGFLRKQGREVDGRISLSCAARPAVCEPAPRRVLLELVVAGQSGRSTSLRVDDQRPRYRGAVVRTPTRVVVRFSEPVVQPQGQPETPSDYTVTGPDRAVVGVEGPKEGDCEGQYRSTDDATAGPTGCTRTLVLDRPLGEDDEPAVTYFSDAGRGPRMPYDDTAGLDFIGTRTHDALDLVRPAVPRIETVAGEPVPSSASVAGKQSAPSLVVSGVSEGHVVFAEALRDGVVVATGAETPPAPPEAPLTGSRVTVPGPALPGDGSYVLRAVVRDLNMNLSTETSKTPGRADGSPGQVTYVLDRVPPVLATARPVDGEGVEVVFSEAVVPERGTPGDWTVSVPGQPSPVVMEVRGSGDRRVLVTSTPVPRGATVTYTSRTTQYVDVARNELPDGSVLVGGVGLPVVTSPAAAPTYVSASSVRVTGTADAGTLVEVLRVEGGARALVAQQQLPAGQTAFSVDVPLGADGPYDFVVRSRDGERTSNEAPVPQVVRDTVAPTLTVQRPAEGEVLAGGRDYDILFDVADDHLGGAPVRIEFSPDRGGTFQLVTPGTADESYTWRTPAVSTSVALLRLTATDLAGNAVQRTSGTFVLDALPPALLPLTRSSRTVLVTFTEPVDGSSSPLDWRVEGEPVSAVEERVVEGQRQVLLTVGPRTTIEPDERPLVEYAPTVLSDQYRDRARLRVERLAEVAQDGILPLAPRVVSPSAAVLTGERLVRVSGTALPGEGVEVRHADGGRAADPVLVRADGTWSSEVPLRLDAANDLRATARDGNGNTSLTSGAVPRIEQDASAPVVTVTEPAGGTRLAPRSRVAVRWTSTDRNLRDRATLVQASTDGGRTFTTLGEQQPASGSLLWDVPDVVTSRALVLVSTPDRVGRTGQGSSGPLGIGADAESPSPSPSPGGGATTSPSAGPTPTSSTPPLPVPSGSSLPSAGPLAISVPGGSIVPGQLADVVVTGRPGTEVELQAYSRPSTTYTRVRTGVLGADGRRVFAVRPGTNTRLFARATDGSGAQDSRTAVVSVRTALSLTVLRNGRRDYTFQGRILPRRSGQLITLYRVEADGRRVITAQLRTDSTGTYRLRRVFTGSGRFGFLTRTGENLTNAAGESNDGRARPTDVF